MVGTLIEEAGRGVPTPGGRVPIVPTPALFDLGIGDPTVRPVAQGAHDGLSRAQTRSTTRPRNGVDISGDGRDNQ